MPQTSERKAILTDLESHMEDVIEIAALEDDKESCIWWGMVEDPLEVYEILSIPRISPREQGPRHDHVWKGLLDRLIYHRPRSYYGGWSCQPDYENPYSSLNNIRLV